MLIEKYPFPLGDVILAAHQGAVCGLWFAGQKNELYGIDPSLAPCEGEREVLHRCKLWLDAYFSSSVADMDFPLSPQGTDFQKKVWKELRGIPYGETRTYGEIASKLNCKSARAIGAAVGKNPISILIPCHRVLGKNSSLTGYAGGLERKRYLLALESRG